MTTVQEALRRTQGRDAGTVNRLSARYAQALLRPGEEPAAAVVANIATERGGFPGVLVLTGQRVLAVCGLPGIRRALSCGEGWTCREAPSAVCHRFSFSDGRCRFSATVDPDTGDRLSRRMAVLRGDETDLDEAPEEAGSGIWNPALLRSRRRLRTAGKKRAAEDAPPRERPSGRTAPEEAVADAETARRLALELREARARGDVAETDPLAVAARLAAELSGGEPGQGRDQEAGASFQSDKM